MKATIVIPNINGKGWLKDSIESVYAQTEQSFRLIVVDNGSTDESLEQARSYCSRENFTLIENGTNTGFSHAVNQGIALADSEYVVLFNNDAFAEPQWLAELIRAAESDPKIFAVQSLMIRHFDRELADDAGDYVTWMGFACKTGDGRRASRYTKQKRIFSACGGAALYRSMGNSKISMQISILMNIINIVGNAVCIFGLKMGVDGVAWPSVISRVVAAVLILGKCYQKGQALNVPKTTRLDARMTKRILGIGIPSAFENSLFQAGRILVVSMISAFGTVQIAANAVANNLDGMGCIPGQAIGLAMITVVGRCVGAGDSEQAIYYTRKLTGWAYITMGVFNGAILIFLPQLVNIYALSGETMVLAETLVRIHAGCAIFLWPVSFVLPNALRAANDVKFTMLVSILSMAVWRLGFSYLLCVQLGWGAVGVWIAMVIDWVCRVICFVARFRSGVWKNKYHA